MSASIVSLIDRSRTRYTAADLMATDFPEPRYAIPGLVPEGLTFFAGAPKLGKSWLALNIAVAISCGGRALGQIPVDKGEVLYLGLEDSPRRLKERLRMVLKGEPASPGLDFDTYWPPLVEGGADELDLYLSQRPNCRAVFVDVFAKVRNPSSKESDRYTADYLAAEPLKRAADKHGVAIVAIHHTRKAASDDFIETVSGTNGLAGAADAVMVMKRSRGNADAELHVTGRDIEERQLALRFDSNVGTWALMGEAKEFGVSEQRRKIIETVRENVALKPKQIAEKSGVDHAVVKHLVRSMVDEGQLDTAGDGYYSIPPSLHSPIHPSTTPSSEESERSEWDTWDQREETI